MSIKAAQQVVRISLALTIIFLSPGVAGAAPGLASNPEFKTSLEPTHNQNEAAASAEPPVELLPSIRLRLQFTAERNMESFHWLPLWSSLVPKVEVARVVLELVWRFWRRGRGTRGWLVEGEDGSHRKFQIRPAPLARPLHSVLGFHRIDRRCDVQKKLSGLHWPLRWSWLNRQSSWE